MSVPVYQSPGPCPCKHDQCKQWGSKIAKVSGHLKGCTCASCRGRQNRQKGQRAQRKTHQALDGQGFTPTHEESGLFYDLTVRPEVKTGQQVPQSFRKFLTLDWTRRAFSQSSRSIPAGVDARACISIDGRWLIVDLTDKGNPE